MWLAKAVFAAGASVMGTSQSKVHVEVPCDKNVAQFIRDRPDFCKKVENLSLQGEPVWNDDGKFVINFAGSPEAASKLKDLLKQLASFQSFQETFDLNYFNAISNYLDSNYHLQKDYLLYEFDLPKVRLTGLKQKVIEAVKEIRRLQIKEEIPIESPLPALPSPPIPKQLSLFHQPDQYYQPQSVANSTDVPIPSSSTQLETLESDSDRNNYDFEPEIEEEAQPLKPEDYFGVMLQETQGLFVVVAKDQSVARFIRMSPGHMNKLNHQTFAPYASLLIKYCDVSNMAKQKLVYSIKSKRCYQYLSTEEKWKEDLMVFLSEFSSKWKYFQKQTLDQAFRKDPSLFDEQKPCQDCDASVKWYREQNKLIVTGWKHDVDRKFEEIEKHLEELVPRTYSHHFSKEIDNEKGKFFLSKPKFQTMFIRLAAVEIKQDNGTVFLHFTTLKKLTKEQFPMFEKKCLLQLEEVCDIWRPEFPTEFSDEIRSNPQFNGDYDNLLITSHEPLVVVGFRSVLEEFKFHVSTCFSNFNKRKSITCEEMLRDLSRAMPGQRVFLFDCDPLQASLLKFIMLHDCFELLKKTLCHFGEVKVDYYRRDTGIGRILVEFHKVYPGIRQDCKNEIICLFEKFDLSRFSMKTAAIRKLDAFKRGLFKKIDDDKASKVFATYQVGPQDGSILVIGYQSDVQQRIADIREAENEVKVKQKGPRGKKLQQKAATAATEPQTVLEMNGNPEEIKIRERCGIVQEIQEQFGKDCVSVTENGVIIEGSNSIVKKARKLFDKELFRQPPTISKSKEHFFCQMNDNNLLYAINTLNNQILKENIKGLLILKSNEVILVCPDEKSHSGASQLIEENLIENQITVEDDVQELFTCNVWRNIIDENLTLNVVIHQNEEGNLVLVGLDKSLLEKVVKNIKQFLLDHKDFNGVFKCDENIANFCIKHSMVDKGFPTGVKLTANDVGCEINGPNHLVEKATQWFNKIVEKIRNDSDTIKQPCFAVYIGSDQAKHCVKSLEEKFGCIIKWTVDTINTVNIDHTFITSTAKTASTLDCSYGNVMVQICSGDITKEYCDIIINGCKEDFTLNWGTVSKAILESAGAVMEVQCRNAPLDQSSNYRVTSGWNLLCDEVIHIATPRIIDDLSSRILEALQYAELHKAKSVAIPTLGAGGIGLDKDLVASAFARAFEQFAESEPLSLNKIKVLVFDKRLKSTFLQHLVLYKTMFDDGDSELMSAAEMLGRAKLQDVTFNVTCIDEGHFQEVTEELCRDAKDYLETEVFEHESLTRLAIHDWIEIYQEATKEVVDLTRSNNITLFGLPESVGRMKEFLKGLVFEFQQSELSAGKWAWQWSANQANFTNFAPRISSAIEAANTTSLVNAKVPFQGSNLIIDFARDAFTYKGGSGHLRRQQQHAGSESPLPQNWKAMNGKELLLVPLHAKSHEYREVEKQVLASKPVLSITKIERIQNQFLFRNFSTKKESIKDHVTSRNPLERDLFHGTSPDDARKICLQGFDKGFVGKNGTAFGKGNYFAVDSNYSTNYAMPQLSSQSERSMILARVLTGDFCRGHPDMKTPPDKGVWGQSCQYDSVVNDVKQPTIFVVFRDACSYPNYLITFRKPIY